MITGRPVSGSALWFIIFSAWLPHYELDGTVKNKCTDGWTSTHKHVLRLFAAGDISVYEKLLIPSNEIQNLSVKTQPTTNLSSCTEYNLCVCVLFCIEGSTKPGVFADAGRSITIEILQWEHNEHKYV